VRLHLLGVRGSTAAPGPDFVRYGGHTSSIAIKPDGGDRPTLVLDAGTGLRTLTPLLDGNAFEGSIVLSHLHWDHMQGLPFFAAGDRPDARVNLYVPAQDGRSGRDLLAQSFAPPAFPITPEQLRGTWQFEALDAGRHQIEGFVVTTADAAHKGGRAFGIRVQDDSGSVAYVPDHVPGDGVSEELLELLHGVDMLFHDAQFLEPERAMADAYGHATVHDAIELGHRCAVGTVVLFHHSPVRTDDALDAIAATTAGLAGDLPVVVAREGMVLEVPRMP
jgi:phosphoribosyl 1,2-cyclic phosphodiesterase